MFFLNNKFCHTKKMVTCHFLSLMNEKGANMQKIYIVEKSIPCIFFQKRLKKFKVKKNENNHVVCF